MRHVRPLLCGLFVLAVAAPTATRVRAEDKPAAPNPAALKRAQDEVKKLDDLYKTVVVGITKTYVLQQNDTPAAMLAAAAFAAMKEKGYHDARLIDATGKPKNGDNVAKTEFEKLAVKAMKDGKPYIEQVATKDGKPVLRAATIVPAVLKSCASCHGVKEGDLLGTIVYEVPIK